MKISENIIRINNLRLIREKQEINRAFMARKIDKTKSSLCHYEKRGVIPNEITRKKIVEFLGVQEELIWPYMLWNKIVPLLSFNNNNGKYREYRHRPDITPEIKEQIIKECYQGIKQSEIAERYKVSGGFVSYLKVKWDKKNLFNEEKNW